MIKHRHVHVTSISVQYNIVKHGQQVKKNILFTAIKTIMSMKICLYSTLSVHILNSVCNLGNTMLMYNV